MDIEPIESAEPVQHSDPDKPTKKLNKKHVIIITGIVAVVIVFITVVTFLLLRPDPANKDACKSFEDAQEWVNITAEEALEAKGDAEYIPDEYLDSYRSAQRSLIRTASAASERANDIKLSEYLSNFAILEAAAIDPSYEYAEGEDPSNAAAINAVFIEQRCGELHVSIDINKGSRSGN